MSKKRKVQTSEPAVEVKSELVTYQVFFQECAAKKLVQPWQEKEIRAFFKDLGLQDKEPVDSYKDALAKY